MQDIIEADPINSIGLERSRAFEPAFTNADRPASPSSCFHCGTVCRDAVFGAGKRFCCQGCLTVFELLTENGLSDFYNLSASAGVRVNATVQVEQYRFLEEPTVRERLVNYTDDSITRVQFRVPAIHCIACVWLLENLFRFKPGIGTSQVNFSRKEVVISFASGGVKLSELVALLASLGYEPELKYADLDNRPKARVARRLWLQLAVAGFAFGNTMLFSIATYLGLDALSGLAFRKLVGFISLGLAIPVVSYSALDYWRSAWISLRQRLLNLDVPIAAGIAALFAQSCYEFLSGRGEGYFDSLAGLLFFLLCGKLFQHKTYDRLAFDRDYKEFFPLSVTRKIPLANPLGGFSSVPEERNQAGEPLPAPSCREERVALSQLRIGDRLVLRNGELLPADSRLISGPALIDYSFVTGESEPVEKKAGSHLYAGGRQMGGAIEVETVKPVSQSYLTSLWSEESFRKEKTEALDAVTNRYSQRFTKGVVAIALGAAALWAFVDPSVSPKAFTAVLIVACPCALALAAPFALGTAQRVLARRNVFLKNPYVIETLAKADAIVFDKTGTLTAPAAASVRWHGRPLSEAEERWIYSLARHSTHPLSVRIGEAIAGDHFPDPVRSFRETAGCGTEGNVAGHEIWTGSAAWLESRGIAKAALPPNGMGTARPQRLAGEMPFAPGLPVPAPEYCVPEQTLGAGADSFSADRDAAEVPSGRAPGSIADGMPCAAGSLVHVAIDRQYRGHFTLASALRQEAGPLIHQLSKYYTLALLSGDHGTQGERFRALFGEQAHLRFNQSPLNKIGFIRELQKNRKTVIMVGDGLNDAGALRQSDVGVAVVENISAFSPASDVILAAQMVPRLAQVLQFARRSMRVVRGAFLISALYNAVGIGIAASGRLSPLVCAILMPVSSATVVAFATGTTALLGRKVLPLQPALSARGKEGHSTEQKP